VRTDLSNRAIFNGVSQDQNQSNDSGFSEITDNQLNKSKLEANTCSWRNGRENMSRQLAIGFGLTSDWMTKSRDFF